MTAPDTPTAPPKPRVTAHDRALRQMRIFARMQGGWSYDAIAQDERLSRERVRQIVAETPALREIDAVRDLLIPGEAAHHNEMMSPAVTE